ncbi:MAG: RNA ligase (ATP) [Bryobacteraceae bacterium]|nr:RNA ligase (ATP) [Bryobacteraceae bacterium]
MSTIRVIVTTIEAVRPHPNADALELATVGGWQVIIKKNTYRDGDAIVYFEQGTVLPREVSEALGVTNYLAQRTDLDGNKVLVIHRVRLRGEPSFGLVIAAEPGMQVGDDVAERYGAKKYFPPVRTTAGDSLGSHPHFPSYTEIENLRSYPNIFAAGEEVIITEKIHGTNCRVGCVAESVDGQRTLIRMAGSKGLRRKEPEPELLGTNTYWFPFTLPGVGTLLAELFAEGHNRAVLYGEVFGHGIQAYHYGQSTIAFRAFDLLRGADFAGYDEFLARCERHAIPTVPLVERGPFSLARVKQLSDGDSLAGGTHGREGVVVRPVVERTHPEIGRVILKYVGDQYLFGKAAEQDSTDL